MYNEENKSNFMSEYRMTNPKIEDVLLNFFEFSQPMEEHLNKDVSNFTVSEITSLYKMLNSYSLESIMKINSSLSIYTNYCLKNGDVKDNQNHFLELDNSIFITCIDKNLMNKKIISFEQLEQYEKELINVSDKLLLRALFEGILGNEYVELFNLSSDQIDGNKVHLCTGRTLQISDKLKDYIIRSCNEYEYYSLKNNSSYKFAEDDSKALKRMYNGREQVVNTVARIKTKIMRIRDIVGNSDLTALSIRESGRINYIKNLMKEQKIEDIAICIRNNQSEITYRYGKITSSVRYILKYGEYF